MVLVSLINISLDISTNIAWWLTKNTLYGTYYLITYLRPHKKTQEELELLELRNEINQLTKQLHMINIINNNPNIISRYQINNNQDDNNNHDIDLQLLDEFVILNDHNDEQASNKIIASEL